MFTLWTYLREQGNKEFTEHFNYGLYQLGLTSLSTVVLTEK